MHGHADMDEQGVQERAENDEINQTKGPFVMFMGHIGVPTKEARQM